MAGSWMADYLEKVREQLQWKLAHPVVLRELKDHLQDQYEACVAEGMEERAAQSEALRQMGDPIAVGRELDRLHRPKPSWEILGLAAALLAANLCLCVFVFYGNFPFSLNHWLWTPLAAIAIGALGCVLAYRMDVMRLVRRPWLLYSASLTATLLAVWLEQTGNARSFMLEINYLGQYTTLLMPIGFGGVVYAMEGKGTKGLLLCGAALLPCVLLCLVTRTVRSLLLLGASTWVMLLLAVRHGAFGPGKKRNMAAVVCVGVAAFAFYLTMAWERIVELLWPAASGMPQNFHQEYILALLQHAKPLGAGEPFVIESWNRVIEPAGIAADVMMSCDYLLAAVSYLCGWTVALALVLGVLALLCLCLYKAAKLRSLWGKLLAAAILVPLLVQAGGYVLANLGFPLSSFELPFVSYGGTYKVVDLTLLGLLLSAFRCRTILRDGKGAPVEKKRFPTPHVSIKFY